MVMRFIAGAVCPACGEQDTLRAEVTDTPEFQYRECVSCGFSETGTEAQAAAREPVTRISGSDAGDGRQVVRILPSGTRSGSGTD